MGYDKKNKEVTFRQIPDQSKREKGGTTVANSLGVIFHVNEADPNKQRSALRNIENLLAEMPSTPVELVIQGAAIDLVVAETSPWPQELEALQQQGVTVAVCGNTMKANHLKETDLLPGMTIVPSAVGELVRKQREGLSYVKP